ncbi:MAG: hypothetical protein R3233_05940 [Xanthomonadales bacterium]|nr:hypothetical protein [Xanthomonadales bacterium]
MTVIMATPERGATLRRPLRFLGQQTLRERIELILIGPRSESFDDLEPALLAGFAACQILAVGTIDEVERAFAPGIQAASAPVVALLENHVYPNPEWANAVVRAHAGPWQVVGCVISNANTATATSIVEHLLSYIFHDEGAPVGEVDRVSRNNTTYKRDALTAFGERLPDLLARDGGLMEELRRGGARFYRADGARLAHLNPSLTGAMLNLRLHSARASAATRARTGRWGVGRRLLYVLASPLFPLLRLRALWPRLTSPPLRSEVPRIAPLLLLALLVDAFGQAAGFALGEGDSAVTAGRYDLDREPFLTAADRAEFMG